MNDGSRGAPEAHEKRLATLLASVTFPPRPAFLPFPFLDLRVDMITDASALLAALTLRFAAYSRARFIERSDFPLGLEFDEFDATSVHFSVHDDATKDLAGYVRLILDGPAKLQVDQILDISDYRARHEGHLCEMSRLIVWPEGRTGVSRAARYAAFAWARMRGLVQIVGVSREADREAFDRRRFLPMIPYRSRRYEGARFAPLTEERLYGNVFDVLRNAEHIDSLLRAPVSEQTRHARRGANDRETAPTPPGAPLLP